MDCIIHGVAKSRTRLSDFHFVFPFLQALSIFHSASVGKEGQDFGQQQFYMLRRLEGTTLSQQQVKS